MTKVNFFPGDLNYKISSDSSSPFSKRSITFKKELLKSKAKLLKVQKKWYKLFYSNLNPIFSSRFDKNVYHAYKSTGKSFIFSKLKANKKQVEYCTHLFFDQLLERLKEDPQSLFYQSEKISLICEEFNYEIPIIESFNQVNDWDEFLSIFESISFKESKFKAEFLMALIIQYAGRCKKG